MNFGPRSRFEDDLAEVAEVKMKVLHTSPVMDDYGTCDDLALFSAIDGDIADSRL